MDTRSSKRLSAGIRWVIAAVLLLGVAGAVTANRWLPKARELVRANFKPKAAEADHDHETHDDDHDAHPGEKSDAHAGKKADMHAGEKSDAHADEDGHAHEEKTETSPPEANDHRHVEADAVTMSLTARENVGIRLAKVELTPFERTIAAPAMVIERPGRSRTQIAAPLTGAITRIYPLQGEAVSSGQPLFDLRLTHEEVVESQALFLQTAEELDVVAREIGRLERVVADGVVAGKTLLERKYEQQKLEAMLRSQRQRLLLHGLSADQIDAILTKRILLSEMTVFVPKRDEASSASEAETPLQVESLKVERGQHVRAGDPLCVLADYSELSIQGKAFERDISVLENAANRDWDVAAAWTAADGSPQRIPGLKILSMADAGDRESRAFVFQVQLSNKLIRDRRTPDGRRFCSWRFKPGQRMELLVPVERWTDRIVLPRNAVVQDGAESFVFEENDGHFDSRAVRVEYRDGYSTVVANDGALTLGKNVVVAGAYQLHLALKNKAAGAPDPHAGHNH